MPTHTSTDAEKPAAQSTASCCHGEVKPSAAAKHFCPMCPGVESDKPGERPNAEYPAHVHGVGIPH